MFRTTCFALAASFAGSAIGQAVVRPDPSDPKTSAPVRPYESAFQGYRPYTDPEIARWRAVNDEMARLKGHAGHVRGITSPDAGAESPSKLPVGSRPGGAK